MPVLSVQITVAEPRVSPACSLRKSARRLTIERIPRARVTVTTAGSPSGTMATASATPVKNILSSSFPKINPEAATKEEIIRAIAPSCFPSMPSLFCKGVFSRLIVSVSRAIRPNSVSIPVATTTHLALPFVIVVPIHAIELRSESGLFFETASADLLTDKDSPVRTDSSALRLSCSAILKSAGTLSPVSKSTMSPGTKFFASIVLDAPFLTTLQTGSIILWSASMAFSAFHS